MSLTQTLCTSFKGELLRSVHDFDVSIGDLFKIALYTGLAELGADTTAYDPTNEVVGGGYTAGGMVLVNLGVLTESGSAYTSFGNVVWTGASFSTRSALIYNTTPADTSLVNPAVCVLDFGSDKTVLGQDFLVRFPDFTVGTALIRVE
jgi:hypothetical protein